MRGCAVNAGHGVVPDGGQAVAGLGQSHTASKVATAAPASCAAMNAGTPPGAMPEKVSDKARAIVTAGLANEVEAVNQ